MRNKLLIMMLGVLVCCGGLAQAIDFYQDATLSQGSYFYADVYNTAVLTVTGGDVEDLTTHNYSVSNVCAGSSIGTIYMLDSSIVNLYGGNLGTITYTGLSKLNVYGYDFSYQSFGGSGWLYGKWADDQSFTLYLRNSPYPSSQIELHEIPEPCSLLLLLGGVYLTKKFSISS